MDLNQNFTRKIGKKMNLIDMNKDIINFKCNFSVISDKTFKAVVITQEQLDNSDFKIEYQDRSIHVLNAPSPAATACLAIGDEVMVMAEKHFGLDC